MDRLWPPLIVPAYRAYPNYTLRHTNVGLFWQLVLFAAAGQL